MTKNFNTLREKRSAEARKRARALAAEYCAEMALDELREALEMTQNHLAKIPGLPDVVGGHNESRKGAKSSVDIVGIAFSSIHLSLGSIRESWRDRLRRMVQYCPASLIVLAPARQSGEAGILNQGVRFAMLETVTPYQSCESW